MTENERLRFLEDRLAIADLVNAYAQAVDRRDTVRAAALFAEDGELIVEGALGTSSSGGTLNGRAQIERALKRLDRYRMTFHEIATHSVSFDVGHCDIASAQTGAVAHHISGPPGAERDRVWYINYLDELVRLPEGWRFARRCLHVELELESPLRAEP
jgi:ketosteroid isomerase-like protein